MKHSLPFILYLAVLSAISGWLMSRMSWIGRVGVNLIHKEYKFLKTWYEGGGIVFGVLLILFLLQYLSRRRMAPIVSISLQLLALIAAICGLWLTYSDFREDFTHSILKERFHLGAYLFWVGWISISLYCLAVIRHRVSPVIGADNKAALMP